ncbi:hypothetical protein EJ03DRAFT_360974 [Teratosphaeria nubilosa]|uniref:C3H1-type domain-containing protein n=1 Tax=Teratosphaeria nubilosa TaxID=161662 RepID=A0A6G1LMR7_9PEZI|nr:hypothetical protein EJ03DRAFT_360974 [Teratosphaeria nubilosa]
MFAQCKHIYFAGCHDVGYINELTQHAANKDRITLVKGPPMHHHFTKLDKSDARAPVPFQTSSLAKTDNGFFNTGNTVVNAAYASLAEPANAEARTRVSTGLRTLPEGFIAVNEDQQRIDPDIPQPSQTDFDDFNRRTARRKLCNNHFIGGHCPEGDHCRYDHTPAPEGVINALKQVVFSNPCPRKGACRRSNCLYGHICQKADCMRRGGKAWCKFGPHAHSMDTTLSGFVPAEGPPQNQSNDYAPSSTSATPKTEEPSKKSLTQEHDDWACSHTRASSQHLSEAQYQASDIETSQSPGGANQWHGSHQGETGDGAQDSDNAASSTTNIRGANLHYVNGSGESGARGSNHGNVQDSVPRLYADTEDWRAHPVVLFSRPGGSARMSDGGDGGVSVKPGDGENADATELKKGPLPQLPEDWKARLSGFFGRS